MIPLDRLEELKKLFAEDGILLTNAEALEIGLWLLARTRSVFTVVTLDKAAQFAKIKRETIESRGKMPLVNLAKWRRTVFKKQTPPQSIDVSA